MEEQMGFAELFDKIFTAGRLGVRKKDAEFWKKVYAEFSGSAKTDFFVWDDSEEAIMAASEFGFPGEIYRNFEDYERQMALLFAK